MDDLVLKFAIVKRHLDIEYSKHVYGQMLYVDSTCKAATWEISIIGTLKANRKALPPAMKENKDRDENSRSSCKSNTFNLFNTMYETHSTIFVVRLIFQIDLEDCSPQNQKQESGFVLQTTTYLIQLYYIHKS